MNSTQAQRDYITSLLTKIGVETAYKAGALTIDQAIDQGQRGGFRTPREAARHCKSKMSASAAITKIKELS